MIEVAVWDETKTRPLSSNAELWFRGHGSLAIAGDVRTKLDYRPIGRTDVIMLYPDGRDGSEIEIPVRATAEMNPEGSDRDCVVVTIFDHHVEVAGVAVEAATGEVSFQTRR